MHRRRKCLENPRGRRAWWADVYGVTQSRTRLKWLRSSSIHSTDIYWVPTMCQVILSAKDSMVNKNSLSFTLSLSLSLGNYTSLECMKLGLKFINLIFIPYTSFSSVRCRWKDVFNGVFWKASSQLAKLLPCVLSNRTELALLEHLFTWIIY